MIHFARLDRYWANDVIPVKIWIRNENRIMTSSNGNIFRITGHLCRNSTVTGEFPAQRPVTRSFDVSLIYAWLNNREAGYLRRHRAHYNVTVMPHNKVWTVCRMHLKNHAHISRFIVLLFCFETGWDYPYPSRIFQWHLCNHILWLQRQWLNVGK